MYTLYNVKRWGSMGPHFVLEELGVPYQNIWMTPEQVKTPAFCDISPLGLIPAMRLDDGRAVFESAAIVSFLTDGHPDKGLAPAPGTADHGVYLAWLVFMSANIYATLNLTFHPEGFTKTAAAAAVFAERAVERSNELFDVVERELVSEGPYMLGDRFSAADLYLFMLTIWAKPSEASLHERCPNIAALCEAVRARPKLRAALEAHGVHRIGAYDPAVGG